jgi:microcin C transport system substrate-binding protein
MELCLSEKFGRIVACEVCCYCWPDGLRFRPPGPPMAMRLGRPEVPAGFTHFDYVNPEAPKGGELRLVSNLRVFHLRQVQPVHHQGLGAGLPLRLLFDTCWPAPWTRPPPATACWPKTWRSRPTASAPPSACARKARFHNGDPVLAADVKHSFDTLIGPYTAPAYKTLLEEVAGSTCWTSARCASASSAEPRTAADVGGLPIFSRKWGVVNGKAKPSTRS